ncbi:MAG: hypothetical protein IIA89_07675 [Chloroflexi bacterium]|nr:hypothetical protein [Chloroflexota bacterium]
MADKPERDTVLGGLVGQDGNVIMAGIHKLPGVYREPIWMLADFLVKHMAAKNMNPGELVQLVNLIQRDEPPESPGSFSIEP